MADHVYDPMGDLEERNPERGRLQRVRWRRWGPYLSDRQWGTVREDYSPYGSFWDSFNFDLARSRAYRWGEDGIAGISDENQLLCLSVVLWNERDSILKERLFGLSNSEGNHGEDVKECYYYLDATPSHSYLKMLYKYPQRPFPYEELRAKNQKRSAKLREFELVDTGCFDEDRYFDVYVEYAKTTPDDILMEIQIHNRGPDMAPIVVLPQLWFRNIWSWGHPELKPILYEEENHLVARHAKLGEHYFYCEQPAQFLFCDNESHPVRAHGFKEAKGYFKDAFHDYFIDGNKEAVNPRRTGTKACARHRLEIGPGVCAIVRCRLSNHALVEPFRDAELVLSQRRQEADAFYGEVQERIPVGDAREVQRQAFAGMIWNKQFYYYDVWDWLKGDKGQPEPPDVRKLGRNSQWQHLDNCDVISMPDKWEFPWYATWDLGFHCITFALIDAQFAKDQLVLLTRENYMHPNGQLPAYECHFSDVNPPVHGWAAWHVFKIDRMLNGGKGDIGFLERVFHKLMLNFTWWVNRKDEYGLNVFQGGFLGLDNIGVFDRGRPLPLGGHIVQADGTSWVATYALDLMRIALELSKYNSAYEDIASKFFQHFLHIAKAMHDIGGKGYGLWDKEDGFYYDMMNPPNSPPVLMRARSVVGLIPLFAVEIIRGDTLRQLTGFNGMIHDFFRRRADLEQFVGQHVDPTGSQHRLLSLLSVERLKAVLRYVFDEEEFLSPYGIRALSRKHLKEPYCFQYDDNELCVDYQPGESSIDQFGGNSNWRGPLWPPINYLMINSLMEYHDFYGDTLKVEYPTGSGKYLNLGEIATDLARRMCRIFLRDENGRRPVFGDYEKYQTDPRFRDHLLFYEYFHGDTGRGCGASHQTGWTGLVANLMATFGGAG